jgi:hypothetical protein
MTNLEIRRQILNECTAYLVHLMKDMHRNDTQDTNPVNIEEVERFNRHAMSSDTFDDIGFITVFLKVRIPDKYLGDDKEFHKIAENEELAELNKLNNKIGGCNPGTYEEVKRINDHKRYVGAMKKIAIINDMLLKLPSVEAINLQGVDSFQEFKNAFKAARPGLLEIRNENSFTDKYLVPFLRSIATALFGCTPLAHFGFYTEGEHVANKLDTLLEETPVDCGRTVAP